MKLLCEILAILFALTTSGVNIYIALMDNKEKNYERDIFLRELALFLCATLALLLLIISIL